MKRFFSWVIFLIVLAIGATFAYSSFTENKLLDSGPSNETAAPQESATTSVQASPAKPLVTHVATPNPVKALYVSSWVASSEKPWLHILDLLRQTEANAIVLDIKDATGRISFLTDNELLNGTGAPENRIKNVREFLNKLHEEDIYVIGRISTFQDPYLPKVKPEWAIMKKSDGSVWKDNKGLPFLDPANDAVRNYLVTLGEVAYDLGFDEINYDYIRYPSDGAIKDIDYKLLEGQTRADTITAFAQILHQRLSIEKGIPISADLFGLTTTERTDMGIGQVFSQLFPYFDYIAPMIYPSHYADGEYGIAKPAEKPYEVVTKALEGARKKIEEIYPGEDQAVKRAEAFQKIRPWIQDFSIRGVTYDAQKVKAQLQAVYDQGLYSWMAWDPSNKYTESAYEPANSVVQ